MLSLNESMPAKKRARQTQSVSSKLLRVIEAFTSAEPALTLSEISRKTEIPLPTAYRFVGEWVAWGGLVRRADGRYVVGTRLWEVGVQSPNLQILKNAAIPYLEDLVSETKQTAQLAILEGFDALYVEKIAARNASVSISRVGSRLPLHATGVGLILLAQSDSDFIENYLARPLKKFTNHTITDPELIHPRLVNIRRTDLIRVEEELHTGILSIAAPVKDRSGKTIAAISSVVPIAQKDDKSLEFLVRSAGIGASRVLGFRGIK